MTLVLRLTSPAEVIHVSYQNRLYIVIDFDYVKSFRDLVLAECVFDNDISETLPEFSSSVLCLINGYTCQYHRLSVLIIRIGDA